MSWNRFFEPSDMENRKGLRAVDTAQLIITGTFFIGSVLIVQRFDNCNGEGRAWYYSMLYGNLFWLFYLFTTLVGKYKNRMIRFFFTVRLSARFSIFPFELFLTADC